MTFASKLLVTMTESPRPEKRQRVVLDLTGDGKGGSDEPSDGIPSSCNYDLSDIASVEALGKLTFDEAAAGGVFKLSRLACALMAAVKSGTAFDEVCDGNRVHGASRRPNLPLNALCRAPPPPALSSHTVRTASL